MKPFRKLIAVFAAAGISLAAWYGATSLVQNVQYARAADQVELNRQELEKVQDMSGVYRKVGKVVEPSVVKIDVSKTIKGAGRTRMPDDMLRRFFPDNDGDGQPDIPEEFQDRLNGDGGDLLQQGEGSGVIMETDGNTGYILTNNHVAGGANTLKVTLYDGREVDDAKVIGTDPKTDLAVIKVNAEHLIPAHWGSSDDLQKGDLICAFGSPFGFVGSMTHGIVSALNRDSIGIIGGQFRYENFIQVDAPINPGNSGGPLVNLKGEVVGINTAILTRNGGFQGIGLAIPSSLAKPVYDQLKEKGKVTRGWLGVEIVDVYSEARGREMAHNAGYEGDRGIFVAGVYKDTPSFGKLQVGDVIVAMDGKQIENMSQLRNTIANLPPDTDVKLRVFRSGKEQDVTIKLGEQPEDMLARARRSGGNDRGKQGESEVITAESLGLRLATPSDSQLMRYGLGDRAGALVVGVDPNSIAARTGINEGDLITKIGDKNVTSAESAADVLSKVDAKKGIGLRIANRDSERFVIIKASSR